MNERTHNFDRQTGRIEYIDIFRAFGIILMVLGHIGFGEKFDLFIHAFHMPMFFFISGFLFKNDFVPFAVFLRKKAKSLLLPYLIFAAVHYVLSIIIYRSFSFESLWGVVYPDSKQIPIAGALWFLLALFFADIIYYWISKISNNRIKWIIVCIVALVGQIIPGRFGVVFPFALGAAFVGVGLMHIGKALRVYEKQITDMKIYQILFFGALTGASILKSSYINMRSGSYPDAFILFWVNAVCASVIGLSIANKLHLLLKNSIVNKYFMSIGRNSVVYLCLNQIVISGSYKIAIRVFAYMHVSFDTIIIEKIMVLFLSLAVLFLLSLLFEKTFLRVLIGRFKRVI